MDASDRRLRASEEAAAWWVRFRSGALERPEREEFVDWMRESAVHVAEMLRIAKVNDSLDQFQGWLKINTDGPDAEDENVIELPTPPGPVSGLVPPPSSRKRSWTGLIAASVAFLMLGAVGLYITLTAHTIETDRGERREVVLADGSVVEVDPETRLRVAFEEHARRVFLEKGRALFRVAKNPARPFLVQADGTTVRAVGTAFGVEHRKEAIVVTVAEGKVAVERTEDSEVRTEGRGVRSEPSKASPSVLSPQPTTSSSSALLLTAGQQVRLPAAGSAEVIRTVNSDRELAWAKGQLVFDNRTVAEAVEEFNHYNRIQLRVGSDGLATRTVSAVFDASDPESFVAFLQTEGTVKVTRNESEIIMQ